MDIPFVGPGRVNSMTAHQGPPAPLPPIPLLPEEQKARVAKIKEMTPAKVAPMACFLMSDRAADVSGQIFAVRKNEIFLFNQPRPLRSVHSGEGWTADEIAERAIPALKSQFTPLEVSADVFPWDPV